MAAEQQLSNGLPPPVTANFNVKPNTLPASRLAGTASPAYNLPLNNIHNTSNTTYQPCLGISQPTTTADVGTSHKANDFYQLPPIANAPSPASACDPKYTSGPTYSPFNNTFSLVNMSAAQSTLSEAEARSNSDTITQHSFKRKADVRPDTPIMETLKRIKAMDQASTTEQQNLGNRSLPGIQLTGLTVEEPPSSGNQRTDATVPKRNVGGRPKTAPLKQKKHVGPTRLRKNKPVVADVHMDIWELILPYCPLRFLFTARNINKIFRERLGYASLWKKCRIQNYGTDMPEPLMGMKEWDYADLVEGLGCMGCQNKRTRKTYWAFQKRWCAKCLEKNTVSVCTQSCSYTTVERLLTYAGTRGARRATSWRSIQDC